MTQPDPGPMMLVATSVMKPPPTLIGKVGPNFTLPRPVTLTAAIAVIIGSFLGLTFGLIIGGGGPRSIVMGLIFGGILGYAAVTVQPMKNESLAKWLGLQFRSASKKRVEINGRPVRLYLGIAPLNRTAIGPVRIIPGGVEVPPDQYDERGVAVSLGSATPTQLTPAPLGKLREAGKKADAPRGVDTRFEFPPVRERRSRSAGAVPEWEHAGPAGGGMSTDAGPGGGQWGPLSGPPVAPVQWGPPSGPPAAPAQWGPPGGQPVVLEGTGQSTGPAGWAPPSTPPVLP